MNKNTRKYIVTLVIVVLSSLMGACKDAMGNDTMNPVQIGLSHVDAANCGAMEQAMGECK